MTNDLDILGRLYQVRVVRVADGVEVHLRCEGDANGGVVRRVDARRTELGVTFAHADGRVVDAAIADRGNGEMLVSLPHADVLVRGDGRRRASAAAGTRPATGQRVIAPMPGRVVRVLVEAGAVVSAGQPLVVVEAMKMENALVALVDGRVREVAVVEGASVDAGRLLVSIE